MTPKEREIANSAGYCTPDSGPFIEKPVTVLKALIDLRSEPTWIIDPQGQYILNEEANRLVIDGVTLPVRPVNDVVTIRGRGYFLERKDMGQNTGCLWYQLRPSTSEVDSQVRRMRECALRLDAVFGSKN